MIGDRIRGSRGSPLRGEKRVEEWRIVGDIVELIELCLRRLTGAVVVVDGGGRRKGF